MQNKLIILRGCSGSGKTTLAEYLEVVLPDCVAYAADDYHYEGGTYNFKIENLSEAHSLCRSSVEVAMLANVNTVIVHNTSTTEKEIKPYMYLAEQYGYDVVSLVVENRHNKENVHNVPVDILQRQSNNLRSNLKLLP